VRLEAAKHRAVPAEDGHRATRLSACRRHNTDLQLETQETLSPHPKLDATASLIAGTSRKSK